MSHPALDTFGDLEAARRDPHVASCPECQAELAAQEQVRDLLGGLPDPGPIPDALAERLQTTFRDLARTNPPEPDTVTSPSSTGTPQTDEGATAATVVPIQQAPTARRRRSPWMVAAAAALVLAVGGAVASQLVPDNGSSNSASSAGAAMQDKAAERASAAAATKAISSGTAYRQSTLATQVKKVLAGAQDDAAAAPAAGPLSSTQGISGCLSALGTTVTPKLIDLATYEGKPAAIIVLPSDDGGQEIWVVSRSCKPNADGLTYFTTTR